MIKKPCMLKKVKINSDQFYTDLILMFERDIGDSTLCFLDCKIFLRGIK